jgi:hypothetical protein
MITSAAPRIYVDFQNADPEGRVRLNTRGTLADIKRQGIAMVDGLNIVVYSEEFEADATVYFSNLENIWTAVIDWNDLREQRSPTPNV